MDDNDKKPVGEGVDEIEDNDDCEDSVQNPATPGNQASPSPVQDAPENEEFLSDMSLNTNQLDDIFYSSRQIRKNCSQHVDALLSPRQHRKVLECQSGFRELLSGGRASSVPSSQDQNIDQRPRVLPTPDTSAGTSSRPSVPTPLSETTERDESVLVESRGSDCVSPLQSPSVRETTQIPQPGRKARKSFPSVPTSVSERTERDGSVLVESRGSGCVSPLQSPSARETTQIPQPGRKARKSFASKSSLPKTITSSRRSFEADMEPTSARKAETERSESDSGESGPRHESFRSKPSPTAYEETLCYSRIRARAREIGTAAQQGDTSESLAGSLSSREREGTSSGSSESEDSRKQRNTPSSSDEHSNEESRGNSASNEESSPSAAEGTSCDSPVNAQVREIRIAAQQDETSEPLSEPLTSRKRERISSGSSENEDLRKQRRMPSSRDEPSNQESSPSTVGDHLDIHPGEASTSGHRPAVSDNRARAEKCLLAAHKLLSGVFRNIEDSGNAIAITPPDFESSNALKEYYDTRLHNWSKRSLRGVEFEVQETYEIFVLIVVQSLVSILSISSSLDHYLVMLNYRNFRNFYVNFTNYWTENKIEDIQDEEIRNRVRRIQTNISDTREAFRNILELVQRECPVGAYMVIRGIYGKDILEGDESYLPQRIP